MTARAAGPILAALLLLAPAPAATAQPEAGAVADVPAGEGRIHGVLTHAAGSARTAGADVILYAVRSGSEPGIRRTQADAEGRFAFEGISTAPDVTYLLGARYRGVPFVGRRIEFGPGETEQRVEVAVAERTRDPRGVQVPEATLRLERIGGELVVHEVHRLRNPGARVIFATPEERAAGAAPAFRAELPAGVTRFALPYAVAPEGVVRDGRQVRFFGPLYPGDQELAFSWALPAPAGDAELDLRLPSGAAQLTVLTPAGVEIAAAALAEPEATEIQGVPYRMLRGGPLAPSARLRLRLHVPPARVAPDAMRVSQARVFLEADDAAMLVSEEYYLEVAGDAPVVGTPDQPLLRIPLPPGARDVRFGSDLEQGASAEEESLVLHGPAPPGESRLDLRYRLPVEAADGSARFARRLASDVPVLSVYIADTGLRVASERMHRRRPVRTAGERTFLHFEAFRLEAGEEVGLSLAPLPPRAAAPRALRVALVALAALGVAFFLAAPLLRRDTRLGAEAADSPGQTARRERAALYENIRDLDHDFETGKLSAEDHAQMRDELRRRAVALLEQERRADAAPVAAPAPADEASAGACPACGAPAAADARFCAQCGRPLAPEAGEDRRGATA